MSARTRDSTILVSPLLHAGAVVLLAGLVLLATKGLVTAAAAALVAGFLAVTVLLGIQRTAALMFFAGMVFAPLSKLTVVPGVTLVTIADACFVVGVGLLLPSLFTSRARPPTMFLTGSLILLVMGMIASVVAENSLISLWLMMRLVAAAIVLPLIFMFWRPDRVLCMRLACGYVLGVCISTGWGLTEGALYDDRYAGLSEHPNVFGLTGLLGVALVPFIVSVVRPQMVWVWWGLGALNAAAIYLSGSRAALVVFVALALVYPFIERSLPAAGWLTVGATVGIAVLGRAWEGETDNAFARLLGQGSASGSDIERQRAIDKAVEQFLARPFTGNGFEGALEAHVIYLQVAVVVGVVGVLGHLMILWSGIRPLFSQHADHRIAYPVVAYAMIGFLTSLMWDRFIWAVLALSFVIASRSRDPDDPLGGAGTSTPEPGTTLARRSR